MHISSMLILMVTRRYDCTRDMDTYCIYVYIYTLRKIPIVKNILLDSYCLVFPFLFSCCVFIFPFHLSPPPLFVLFFLSFPLPSHPFFLQPVIPSAVLHFKHCHCFRIDTLSCSTAERLYTFFRLLTISYIYQGNTKQSSTPPPSEE